LVLWRFLAHFGTFWPHFPCCNGDAVGVPNHIDEDIEMEKPRRLKAHWCDGKFQSFAGWFQLSGMRETDCKIVQVLWRLFSGS
jgi:hypothetical protein